MYNSKNTLLGAICNHLTPWLGWEVPIYECGENESHVDTEYLLEVHFYAQGTECLRETIHFSVLCAHKVPPLSHSCSSSPQVNWTHVYSGGGLPTNSFPAGLSPTGETLYLGLIER